MKDVIEFIHDNGRFIVENAYIFVIWTLICVSTTHSHFFEHQDIRTPGRDAVGILHSLSGVFIFQIIPMRP